MGTFSGKEWWKRDGTSIFVLRLTLYPHVSVFVRVERLPRSYGYFSRLEKMADRPAFDLVGFPATFGLDFVLRGAPLATGSTE